MNIHRSQFSGRNFEYYSEDGLLSGLMAAEVCKGAKSKGVYTYIKHFALNDQETNRSDNGLATWANEQSMREIYFKPFEIAVKSGGANAVMSSFNRIGSEWAGASYDLLTEVLRNEWGFKGVVITDYNNGKGSYMDLDMMIRAGGDLNLFQSSWLSTDQASLTPTHVAAMRKASHNILYVVANSNAMNNPYGPMLLPQWVVTMIIVMAVITAGLGVWGYFVIRKAYRKQPEVKK
jgi:beta-glucosidase